MSEEEDYKVGYGRPPKHAQFKKGQSGNPKGRPKKRTSEKIDVVAIIDQPVKARINGRMREITTFEASIRRLAKSAIEGDFRSLREFIRLCEQNDLIEPAQVYRGGGVLIAPRGIEYSDWLESIMEPCP